MTTRTKRLIAIIVAVVVVLAVILTLVLTLHSNGTPTANGSKTPSPVVTAPSDDPTASGSPVPDTTPTAPVGQQAPPVAPNATATGDGVIAELTKIEKVTGKGGTPGEVGGPALRLTVTVTNTGSKAFDASAIVVNALVGADEAPAGTVMQPGGNPFSGQIEPGQAKSGVYIFVIPTNKRSNVSVLVDYQAGSPILVFRGSFS
jgi:hypothetical protein